MKSASSSRRNHFAPIAHALMATSRDSYDMHSSKRLFLSLYTLNGCECAGLGNAAASCCAHKRCKLRNVTRLQLSIQRFTIEIVWNEPQDVLWTISMPERCAREGVLRQPQQSANNIRRMFSLRLFSIVSRHQAEVFRGSCSIGYTNHHILLHFYFNLWWIFGSASYRGLGYG